MREKYESLSLAALKELAKSRKLRGISTMKKADIIELMLKKDEEEREEALAQGKPEPEIVKTVASVRRKDGSGEGSEGDIDAVPSDKESLDSGIVANGILEVMSDGFGFIRSDNYMPGDADVYVAPSQIRRFNLKTGDIIVGNTRIKTQGEKFSALLYVKTINGLHPSEASRRPNFEDLTPIFPNSRLRLEIGQSSTAMRIMDLMSPVGKGQRGMIVSPPKAGKTTLLKEVAKSITYNYPEMYLIVLLIDERPEEVNDIKESVKGRHVEVIYSTFDELPEHHKRVSEMVIERAKRLVEHGKDVMILLDSITRLARAYNLTVPPSGRTLSGGLDPAALHMPKRFFGAARNMREGGSLTILATALVETGSKMDDVVYEEFKGTGNMEMVLNRKLQEKRVFPAIDIPKSGTRREDQLLSPEEMEAVNILRRGLNGLKPDEAVEQILNLFVKTRNNREFIDIIKKKSIF
ncbi:MAG: transcription termination factor Rho [Lachnospiraceae bacterium]|nr:transcription termination factor Rho [Lachnospiraceae bacterium]